MREIEIERVRDRESVCVCVCDRERERESEIEREKEREREKNARKDQAIHSARDIVRCPAHSQERKRAQDSERVCE